MWDSPTPTECAALELLHRLEEREKPLLTWGFLDGGFTEDEVQELAQGVLDDLGEWLDPAEVVDLLQDRRLLFDLSSDGRRIYRTRFAEAVRLFAGLRQMFEAEQWDVAPRLVADYRVAMRPRRYPPRNIPPDQALGMVEAQRRLQPIERITFQALLQGPERQALARFQVRAAAQVLRSIRPETGEGGGGGTLVGAGTGTGKTLAFYLPCLTAVAHRMRRNDPWTQAMAIYPRNELLKDQFTEACREARRLRGVGPRPVRIGAYFGLTPREATRTAVEKRKWDSRAGSYVCPYLRCPACEANMLWPAADLDRGRERLVCEKGCGEVTSDEVSLTRRKMEAAPPDLLFTTTEMLNRQMSNTWAWKLFGIGRTRDRTPYLMLLDEVHTYTGTHGAQVGLLIRRWRQMVRHPVHMVGLSATLSDPVSFFSGLTGLHEASVSAIDPGNEFEQEGKEYHLVLRGDPVSGTSLLSTTIQAAMLLGRVLDPLEAGRSGNVFSPKTFVFTDDLDVTNRLYHNLLNAEGRDSWGRPLPNKLPLASLRQLGPPNAPQRLRDGQLWSLCQWVGHSLDNPPERLRIGRTSSQDTGVDAEAEVIVATSALEVGYNDSRVGAIVQHKAPRDAASFLQRKGRAGRRRITRPWTMVVLSDYGRDRLAYQAYEQLFDPLLEKAALPVQNRHVLRMQATYALMEWMAGQLFDADGGVDKGSVWDDFTGPHGSERQRQEGEIIRGLLLNPEKRRPLAEHLERALQISPEEVQALFWEPPRALMTAVLPTLWRRLTTGWHRVTADPRESDEDYQAPFAPLPDFVPSNLFSDLNLPEVRILTPGRPQASEDEWSMPLTQALVTFPPGRVTRRFGVHHIAAAHWIAPPDLSQARQQLPVSDFCSAYEHMGGFQVQAAQGVADVPCVRPWTLVATQCPANVLNTSNARLDWRSQLYAPTEGVPADVPGGPPFDRFLAAITFFTHNQRCPARVRRFAVGSQANLLFKGGGELSAYVRFVDGAGKEAMALGFEQEVDGILFHWKTPSRIDLEGLSAGSLRACRTAYFRDRVENDPILLEKALGNRFRVGWAGQVFLSLLLNEALAGALTLEAASDRLSGEVWTSRVRTSLETIFQVIDASLPDEEDVDASHPSGGRVYDALNEFFQHKEVRERLLNLASVLWETSGPEWDGWLRRRLKTTFGAALLQACYQLSPQFQSGDLVLDIDPGPPPPGFAVPEEGLEAIWITEMVIGGGGVLEEILRRYVDDPRHFHMLVETALGPSDFELVDRELTRLAELAYTDGTVADAFAQVRGAATHRDLDAAREALMRTLGERHVLLTHPVMTALNARMLRPGSSPRLDDLLRLMLQRWSAAEDALQVEVDARVFAYLASTDPDITEQLGQVLAEVGTGGAVELRHRYGLLYGLVWPRGSGVRERSLEAYNPFVELPGTDPTLLMDQLYPYLERVEVEAPDWRARADLALAEGGIVRLTAAPEHGALLRGSLLGLVSQPVDAGFLRLFPYVARLERSAGGFVATVHLREAVQ